jgi:hypothetical protein
MDGQFGGNTQQARATRVAPNSATGSGDASRVRCGFAFSLRKNSGKRDEARGYPALTIALVPENYFTAFKCRPGFSSLVLTA